MQLLPKIPRATRRGFLISAATTIALSGRSTTLFAQSPEALTYHSRDPHNAEPPLADLVADWITPNERFYIRSHAPTPEIDVANYRLAVEGLVGKRLSLSMADLKALADTEAVATMTCAGNRRSEMASVRQIKGVPWNEGAIGNARWGGVKLSTILKAADVSGNARHVWFEGLDAIPKAGKTAPFGGSIPIEKALADSDTMPGALVALTMNGKSLPPDHGYPARTVVPGYIGARSVKWLGRIVVSDRLSPNHYQQDAYKIVPSSEKLAMAEAAPIYTFPINSVICVPTNGHDVSAGKLALAGYSLPTGTAGTTIERVELSTDNGGTWTPAKFQDDAKVYCWRRWQAEIEIDSTVRQVAVRARDSRGNRQPATVAWNAKGYLQNNWHRINVNVGEAM